MPKPITIANLAAEMRNLARSINYQGLEAQGLLSKAGAWYHAPNVRKLPSHVRTKIKALRVSRGKTFVKFYSDASVQRTKARLKKILTR